jgi:hypothetical protein
MYYSNTPYTHTHTQPPNPHTRTFQWDGTYYMYPIDDYTATEEGLEHGMLWTNTFIYTEMKIGI